MFAGEPVRDDSLGCSAIARPGALNLMTAGRGITHSGQSPPRNPGRLHGLQLWVALSDSNRKRDPAFDHYTELPAPEPGGGQAQVLMVTLARRAVGLAPSRRPSVRAFTLAAIVGSSRRRKHTGGARLS